MSRTSKIEELAKLLECDSTDLGRELRLDIAYVICAQERIINSSVYALKQAYESLTSYSGGASFSCYDLQAKRSVKDTLELVKTLQEDLALENKQPNQLLKNTNEN